MTTTHNSQKLEEFMTLLKSKNRKEINKWKDLNRYTTIYEYGINLTRDADIIFNLFEGDIIFEFVEYLNPPQLYSHLDSQCYMVKWKSQKKKKEFFEKF